MDCPARQWCDYFTNTKLQTFVGQSPRDYKDHDLKAVTWNNTVKTLYNVTRYNRIFNIRHKIAGNGSVSIKIPSL